jgi:uncharacterized protein YecE (DUF72 family)
MRSPAKALIEANSSGEHAPGADMAELWIGTSGWVYKHWIGVLYPPKLPAGRYLPRYAAEFPTVEINRSYYRLPERSVVEAWRQQSPPGFLFAVKASRFLTHMKKLKDPEQPLERLMTAAAGLGEKLGPVLFQFPRQWRMNLERLDDFLGALRPYAPTRFAFEFRHASWLVPAVYARLERAGCALCLPVGWGIPLDVQVTAPWTYIRMHGGETTNAFADQELATWAARIGEYLASGTDVYTYFNNDPWGDAVRDAARLRGMLSSRDA